MKIRAGFVSNSSSSSFVCEVCGDMFESYNDGIAHFNLVMCKDRDHLFCEAHRINPIMDKDYNESYTMYEADPDNDDGETRIDSIHCPICQMKHITNEMLLSYALKKIDSHVIELKKEMTDNFNTYDEFENFLKNDGKRYGIELTAHVTVVAPNEELAHRYAREEVIKHPSEMLDVTHCEGV